MNVLRIAARELKSTFSTVVGWLVACGFLLLSGAFWVVQVSWYIQASTDLVYNPFGAQTLNVTEHLLQPYFQNTTVVVLMVAPALTMRSFAEEFRQRTYELLLTSPVSTAEIVLGKFLGALGFVAVLLAWTSYAPASVYYWANPDIAVVVGGYLSLLLLSASLLALGLLCSSLTNNQIVSLILAFSIALAVYVIGWMGQGPDSWQMQMSFAGHLDSLQKGGLKVSDLAYYAGLISLLLFTTHQRMESFRWS